MAQAGSDRYSPFGRHVACHPLEQMLAALTFAADGVLERFPELKVAQLEAGCGWIPYWLERMDEHWKHYTLGRERTTKELPSAYWKRQCVVSCEAGEELIGCFVEHVGDDYLIMATDYPHADAAEKFPEHTVGDLANNSKPCLKRRGERSCGITQRGSMVSSRFLLYGEFSKQLKCGRHKARFMKGEKVQ